MVIWVYALVLFDEFFEFILTKYAHVLLALSSVVV